MNVSANLRPVADDRRGSAGRRRCGRRLVPRFGVAAVPGAAVAGAQRVSASATAATCSRPMGRRATARCCSSILACSSLLASRGPNGVRASARISCWLRAACSRVVRGRRRRLRRSRPRNGAVCAKPRRRSRGGATRSGPAHPWASRGGLKLAAALDAFGLDPGRLACLDWRLTAASPCVSAAVRAPSRSTSAMASSTPASPPIRACARSRAATRATLTPAIFGDPPAIVCDVSFISQRLVLPAVLRSRRARLPRQPRKAAVRGRPRESQGLGEGPRGAGGRPAKG